MKKITSAIVTFISIVFLSLNLQAQSTIDINDANYKFNLSLPSDWKQGNKEETSKQDAISYSFEKKDGKIAIMLLAFKVSDVKNLEDFVYTIEKDLTLNIPKRDGDYTNFDMGNYDGKSGLYKDTEFKEEIYFYRTKINESMNYTYVLRFIVPSSYYNAAAQSEIKKIAGSFAPSLP